MSDAATAFRDTKSFCAVNGYQMAFVDVKDDNFSASGGDTMIFLHGNPTSSYLWRNVMAPLKGTHRRLIAPDLIGMGDSEKLSDPSDETYSFENHANFLDAFLADCIDLDESVKVVLVLHDWGSGLGFWWGSRHPDQVKGIAYMEAIVKPMLYSDFDPATAEFFQAVRAPVVGERMILEQNVFVEQILPSAILRNLTAEEFDVYKAPYLSAGEDRRPTLAWPREVPINGTPVELVDIVTEYSEWFADSDIPKLLVSATPGLLLVDDRLEFARTMKNQQEVTVNGLHFVQEDSPDDIAHAIDNWLESNAFLTAEAPYGEIGSGGSPMVACSNPLWYFLVAALLRKLW